MYKSQHDMLWVCSRLTVLDGLLHSIKNQARFREAIESWPGLALMVQRCTAMTADCRGHIFTQTRTR
uniref:Uncharacterized protein n=1 Tax=Anguilla anguilla TaxID=7936 RepID=A0A0E9X4C9_ANGAN